MASTTFLLVSQWTWDHTNHEFATITLENYEFDEIGGIKNLSPSRMPRGLIDSIKKIKEAQDRSILGSNKLLALYQITNRPDLREITHHSAGAIKLSLSCICKFDQKGTPIDP